MKKAIFFDRDGTINVEKHYLSKIEEFELIDGVVDALKMFQYHGYLLILVTNQSGIARGYYTEESMNKLHKFMQKQLKEKGTGFDGIYYCPHHPEGVVEKYRCDCQCRKPKGGLFQRAIEDFQIDPRQSIAIGDKERDLKYPMEIGMKCILIDKDCNKTKCSDNLYLRCRTWNEIVFKLKFSNTKVQGKE